MNYANAAMALELHILRTLPDSYWAGMRRLDDAGAYGELSSDEDMHHVMDTENTHLHWTMRGHPCSVIYSDVLPSHWDDVPF